MYVSDLFVYPIKSLRPTKLQEATFTRHGILYDRCFMLCKIIEDSAGNQELKNMHVPHFPAMSLFLTDLILPDHGEADDGGRIIVTYQQPPVSENNATKTLHVPLQPEWDDMEETPIMMHQSSMVGYKMGRKYSDWFSDRFGFPVILVYTGPNRRQVLGSMNPNVRRRMEQGWLSSLADYVPSFGRKEDDGILTFADCAAYMVVNDTSVKQVSSRFKDGVEVDVTKFRPNVVVGGAESAWEEDYWEELAIGGTDRVQLALTSNCVRCRSLDVDYQTGGFHKTDDGLVFKKLTKDRRVDSGAKYSPVFGRYGFLKGDEATVIRVGDPVAVSKKATARTTFDWPGLS
ncbi:MOSC domain protein [Talaromyces proteolyticus]|uniref:MOSC domain protein n=1 Tax=Talaromyces proteolyticus TaxID=1131652 RepID=A0AAD4PZJ1_9EURO|nr:MOSC domain protein [Talaromyces proteolyticus]KAH8695948.1 MOSC domain protein [Talaromyces proteolyticus]